MAGVDPNLAHLPALAKALPAPWQPYPALTVNQATLRVIKLEGHSPDFHTHDVDECYVVLEGEMLIEVARGASTHLAKGDAYVVRAGTVHRPLGLPLASVLLIT
jgi:mannose-6-phosphate isomerase-like protein (cupin superfamily)